MYTCMSLRQAQASLTYDRKRNPNKGNLSKGNINVLVSEYAMHSYGIRLCTIDWNLKYSSKDKSEQKESSIALVFHCKYAYCTICTVDCVILSIHSAKQVCNVLKVCFK